MLKRQQRNKLFAIEEIRHKISKGEFLLSQHAVEESSKDMIEDEAIVHAILNGEIIESYPDDPRGESCLINGDTPDGRHLHIVIGRWQDQLIIITCYIPSLPKWITPTQRRKKEIKNG